MLYPPVIRLTAEETGDEPCFDVGMEDLNPRDGEIMLENAYFEARKYGFMERDDTGCDEVSLARQIIAFFEIEYLWDLSDYWTGNFVIGGYFD